MLRDTGASGSFILGSVLPFSNESYTGNSLLIRGIGLNTISVPLHTVSLECELVEGDVELGVRPALPIDGISVVLGNQLAGRRIWSETSSPLVVTEEPLSTDESAEKYPKVFSACVVTRSASRKTETDRVQSTKSKSFSLADYPVCVSREELAEEQKSDETLKSLFELIDNEIRNKAGGYFVKDGVLLRKWSPHADCFVGDPIVQVVVPAKLRLLVLETTHDKLAGHAGVQKTYDHILSYFHWPRVKLMLPVL